MAKPTPRLRVKLAAHLAECVAERAAVTGSIADAFQAQFLQLRAESKARHYQMAGRLDHCRALVAQLGQLEA